MGVKTPSLEELAAKQAITEVIHRYCRGMDRMDRAITLSCWHPGGTDDHAPLYKGSAEGFVDWLWPVHAAMTVTRHVVSNILINLNGDKAGVETYWSLVLRVPRGDEEYDIIAGGRYLDQFECIDGVWAIRHRSSLMDVNRVEPVRLSSADFADPPLIVPVNLEAKTVPWARDASDHSYSVIGHVEARDPPAGAQ
jgi:SnoaL-like domain